MGKIRSIDAREILDSKGLSAIEVMVTLEDGKTGIASCSVDQDAHKALDNIKNVIGPKLIGKDAESQPETDKVMIDLDGTEDKSNLGTNVVLAVSMAVAKAGAQNLGLPLFLHLRKFLKIDNEPPKIPIPIFNFISGGNHENILADFREFLVIPASSKSYLESIQIGEKIRKSLKEVLEAKFARPVNDYEENFIPELVNNKEGFFLINQAAENTHIRIGFDVFLGLDSKGSSFFKEGKYHIKDASAALSSKDMIKYYEDLSNEIRLLYIEDPLSREDTDGWAVLFEKLSASTIIAGGDLISTNLYRLQEAINKKIVNAVVIKPNQTGTVIESLAIAEAAKETGLKVIVSHRNNEANDDFLSDFAVAVSADYIKMGSLSRGENIVKYNRLLQIENQLKVL